MSYENIYKQWLSAPVSAGELAELLELAGLNDELADRFSSHLDFGTAGLRGLVGMGTNRMNIYTVRRAARGFGSALLKSFSRPRVCIGFDARHDSRAFAHECAAVLAGQGIEVLLFSDPRPTPQLSFAIRHFGLDGGINITASHNPKGYSGFKAYWRGGAQITGEIAELVAREMMNADLFEQISADSTGINSVPDNIDELYINACLSCVIDSGAAQKAAGMKIVYTAFHGVGGAIFPNLLARAGYNNLVCVERQIAPDGDFPTLDDPNPENPAGFALATELAENENADLIIGTDPDADRVATLARGRAGEWCAITGSQMGALLIDYIIKARRENGTLPAKYALVQTIVTGALSLEIARKNGAIAAQTFTGFRFMAERVEQLALEGIQYLLACEEAIGYMTGGHVRDKDGMTTGLIIAEMAAHYYAQGQTLIHALEALWREYGSHAETTVSLPFPGASGAGRMSALMHKLRQNPPDEICGMPVEAIEDCLEGVSVVAGKQVPLDKHGMDVLIFRMQDASVIVRPSGTEPKIKIYLQARAQTPSAAAALAEKLAASVAKSLGIE